MVRSAVAAPSVQNTQPWHFTSRQNVISLYADCRRWLPHADPAGREMVISCGAALFNMRLAMRHLGFAAIIRLLPDPAVPDLLAEVRWGWHAPPTREEEALYGSITRRHTHRGPFTAPMPPTLIPELVQLTRHEQAELHVLYDAGQHQPLAELIRAAERAQCASPGVAMERLHWTRPPGDSRRDGVPASAYALQPDGVLFAGRRAIYRARRGDPGPGYMAAPQPDNPHALGIVALLATREDRRLGWLLAGHALQHLLLHAALHGVAAAFHTQPLESPGLREQIRAQFTGGAYPQMLLRLGRNGTPAATPRRPATDTLTV